MMLVHTCAECGHHVAVWNDFAGMPLCSACEVEMEDLMNELAEQDAKNAIMFEHDRYNEDMMDDERLGI